MIPADCRYVFERSVLLVVQQKHAAIRRYRQVNRTVIVVIAGSTADGMDGRIQSRFLRHIFKLAAAKVVKKR